MATHALPASHIGDDEDAPAAIIPSRPSLMRRLYDAVLESQMRRARLEIDRKLGPGTLDRARRAELPPR